MQENTIVKISILDDHKLFRNGIVTIIDKFNQSSDIKYITTIEASNGNDLIDQIKKINKKNIPQIILADINMPEMNGFDTIKWLRKHQPEMKILVMTMLDDDLTLIKALKLGAN